MQRVNHIHFVGIGGAGMCGIAEVLHNLGYEVSGTDLKITAITQHLDAMGIRIHHRHSEAHVNGSDVVVYSAAVAEDNTEILAARNKKIPVVPRAEMLSELMRFRQGIAIAGTHGKTTTTSLIASLLAEGGLDPTYVIGGRLNSTGSNARLGAGRYLVAEADESDGSFLHLCPVYAVITNIDADHLENYQASYDNLKQGFTEFLYRLPFYGLAVVCLDDAGVQDILADIHKPVVTYGIDSQADYIARNMQFSASETRFELAGNKIRQAMDMRLNMPGRHNVSNALAACAVAAELGVSLEHITAGLARFAGIDRRSSLLGSVCLSGKTVQVIDDYAHHPTEIRAVYQAVAAGWPAKRIVVVFQPHRYTRTRDLFEEFCQVLAVVEVLLVLDIYPAGEQPITGVDSRTLCRAIGVKGGVHPIYVTAQDDVAAMIAHVINEGDMLLILGAGDIGQLGPHLYQQYGTAVN